MWAAFREVGTTGEYEGGCEMLYYLTTANLLLSRILISQVT